MQDGTASRRDILRWMVSSFVVLAASPAGASNVSSWTDASPAARSDLLFGDHLPHDAKQTLLKSVPGLYVAVYESPEPDRDIIIIKRWLCIASEVNPGRFDIHTSERALAESSTFHPADVSVEIIDENTVQTREGFIRGNSLHKWVRSNGHWELSASSSVGVLAGEIHQQEYDQLRQEVIVSRGKISDEGPLASTRHAKAETLALTTYSRGPLV